MALYDISLIFLFFTAPIIFIVLFYFKAPYGRYVQKQWGPLIPNRYGWIMMELPAVLILPYFFYVYQASTVAYVFLMLWEIHYINRTFIYPFRLNYSKSMSWIVPISGFFFNTINGFINGVSLTIVHVYETNWLWDPRFIIGVTCFVIGFVINQHSDTILLRLKKTGQYQIPYGGLYRWISCPNYLGEILEWLGWAIATWSWAGFAFAIWTMANLIPRAYKHHAWYQKNFPQYPKRRALF